MIWNIDPELIHIGPIAVRWYGLFFAASFLIGYQIMEWIYRTEKKPKEDLDSLLLHMFLGTILGARLGHCLFYEPTYYLSNPLEILKVWHGGLASHGAVIGILFALYLFCRKHPATNFVWLLSRMCITVALAGFFIRSGNFFNSEIVGRATDLPWAVVFKKIDNLPRHPAQLYEAFSYLLIFSMMFYSYFKLRTKINSYYLLGNFFIAVFGARFVIEFFKEPQVSFEASLPLDLGQLLSIPVILFGCYLVYRGKTKVTP